MTHEAFTSDELSDLIQSFSTDRRFLISQAFLDGGIDSLSARLLRAAVDQAVGNENTPSRYGIWANTVRDNIRQAAAQIELGDMLEAHRLLYRAANSLSAFAEVQALFANKTSAATAGEPESGRSPTSRLAQGFLSKLHLLEDGFPVAAAFLAEVGRGAHDGFWLSTAQNAHLYYRDAYYIYVKPTGSTLEFRGRFNSHIAEGTGDRSESLFRKALGDALAQLDTGPRPWSAEIDGGYVLTNATPAVFFTRVCEVIREVHAAYVTRRPAG